MPTNDPDVNDSPDSANLKWIVLGVGILAALVAALVLLSVLIAARLQVAAPSSTAEAPGGVYGGPSGVLMPEARPHPQEAGNRMGDPNAPVKIVEYADFQCPYCREYWQVTEPQIIQNYIATGKVDYEYHSVGAFIGPESADAANAAYCAADQNHFWEYHDVLFANWTGENAGDFTIAKLKLYADAAGLTQDTFYKCVDGKLHMDRVDQDVADAQAAGVRATPTFLINGKLVEGAQPFSVFQQVIDAALQGQ
jgi:protein-disulfide isomerase